MIFYKGELRNFDLCKMQEIIGKKLMIMICNEGKTNKLEGKKENLIDVLKENNQIYYLFGKREGKYLSCVNGKKYVVDDERTENSRGIFMGDAYFNKYDDINLGFLLSYKDDIIDIQAAIEGEGIDCRRYEVIDNCGDLDIEMKIFIDSFIK